MVGEVILVERKKRGEEAMRRLHLGEAVPYTGHISWGGTQSLRWVVKGKANIRVLKKTAGKVGFGPAFSCVSCKNRSIGVLKNLEKVSCCFVSANGFG